MPDTLSICWDMLVGQLGNPPELLITEWLAIGILLSSLVGLGLYMKDEVNDSAGMFLRNRSLSPTMQAFSTAATKLNATDFIGLAGFGYTFGIIGLMTPIATAIAIIISSILIIPFIREIEAYSLGEWLNTRFSSPVGEFYDVIWTFIWTIINMGLYIYGGALVLTTLLGWDLWLSVGLVVLIGSTYTILGGFGAVAGSDIVQFVLMFIPFIFITPIAIDLAGGLSGIVNGIPAYKSTITPTSHPLLANFPFGGSVAVAILYLGFITNALSYFSTEAQVLQRPLAAKSSESAQLGHLYTGLIFIILIPSLMVIPGVVAASLYPNLETADHAMPMLIRNIVPPGLYGVVIVGLLAGVFSSIDSQLNNFQTLLTERIYRKHFAPNKSGSHYVNISRIAGIIFMILSVGVAYYFSRFSSMYLVLQSLLVTIMPTFAAVAIVGGIYDRATSAAALAGILFGLVFSVYLGIELGHDAAYIRPVYSLFMTMIVIVVTSFFTTPLDEEQPTQFVTSIVDENNTTVPDRAKLLSAMILFVVVVIYAGATIAFQVI
jgi:SSS family solute:Na+ symporter